MAAQKIFCVIPQEMTRVWTPKTRPKSPKSPYGRPVSEGPTPSEEGYPLPLAVRRRRVRLVEDEVEQRHQRRAILYPKVLWNEVAGCDIRKGISTDPFG